jgi:hypothetical protein
MPCRMRNPIREFADQLNAHSTDENVNPEKQMM